MAVVGVVLAVLSDTRRTSTEVAGVQAAEWIASQVGAIRRFYGDEVLPRATNAGAGVNYDYKQHRDVLPIPETMVNALGDAIAESSEGSSVRLYSRYPFPHRAATERYDDFEMEALDALEANPYAPVHEIVEISGRLSVRYAVADTMLPGCVACHNIHPDAPRHDWKVGDVRGVLEVILPIEQVDDGIAAGIGRTTLSLLAGVVVLVIAVFSAVRRAVLRPMARAVDVLERVQAGDLTPRLLFTSDDEIGRLATSLNQATDSMSHMVRKMAATADSLTASSGDMALVSEKLGVDARDTSTQACNVSEAAETVKQHIQSVATGTEEMQVSIREISRNSQEAADAAQDTVRIVESTNATIGKLGDSSNQIGTVIKVINSVAEQTNLLALNATIEAARAGDAGKGFAVVANEVKELAKETAKATQDIGRMIQTIQTDSNGTVEAMQQITEAISKISHIQNGIASSIEEQAVTTAEIGRSISEAARGSAHINESIVAVARAADGTSGGATEAERAAAQLAKVSTGLLEMVTEFQC